ncbi:MAG: YggT family protein [Candidatus Puniceispirillaceae bacterium]
MTSLLLLLDSVLQLYIWSLIIYVVASWLIAFNIINPWQPTVRLILTTLQRIHEPVMGRIRSVLPDLGGLDISPIIVLLAVQFARNFLFEMLG